jgi:D-alanyl-D-alanine carboxypeptidase
MTTRSPFLRSALVLVLVLTLGGCATSGNTPSALAPTTLAPLVPSEPPTTIAEPSTSLAPTTTATSKAEPSTTAAPVDRWFSTDQQSAFGATLRVMTPTLPNPAATVMATVRRADGRTWTAAADNTGQVRVAEGASAPTQPVRIASVGKTFTAATVFRLIEQGRLSFDDPISLWLTPTTVNLLIADGYDPSAITVRHLLQHTSGLFDYAFGEGSPLLNRALNDQTHRWTRQEQLELAMVIGDPLGPPGQSFHYSDTSYVLAAEIIEQITGRPYQDAMRDLLHYERLGLRSTWLESGEVVPPETAPIARSFFGNTDLTNLDFSIDAFGGGGLAATTDDLSVFFEALFAGDVFDKPATLAMMTDVPATNGELSEFGVRLGDGASGLYRLNVETLGTCWGHRGFMGTIVVTCPTTKATVALTTNTALTDPLPSAIELLRAAVAS